MKKLFNVYKYIENYLIILVKYTNMIKVCVRNTYIYIANNKNPHGKDTCM